MTTKTRAALSPNTEAASKVKQHPKHTKRQQNLPCHRTDTLLSRLEGVRNTGAGQWVAKCSAHEDRHPSVAIRELDDGRILLHCFAGCDTYSVLSAIGLSFEDLFPDRVPQGQYKPVRRPFNASDILRCVAFEALVAAVAAGNIAQGIDLTKDDHDRLFVACGRLQEAAEMVSHA